MQSDLFAKLNIPFEKKVDLIRSSDLELDKKYSIKCLRGVVTQWGCKIVVDLDDEEMEGTPFLPARYTSRFVSNPEHAKNYKCVLSNAWISKVDTELDRFATPIYIFGNFTTPVRQRRAVKPKKDDEPTETQLFELPDEEAVGSSTLKKNDKRRPNKRVNDFAESQSFLPSDDDDEDEIQASQSVLNNNSSKKKKTIF